jgi:hemoglobin
MGPHHADYESPVNRPALLRTDKQAHPHALARRAEKRAAAEALGVDADYIGHIVEAFYAKVREDDLIGPIFAERIADWPPHLARMKAFWRSVLHNSGEFSGNPMLKHLAIPGLEERHFAQWLDLFYATLRELQPTDEATLLVDGRARMIADSLLTAIAMRRDGLAGGRAGTDLPRV